MTPPGTHALLLARRWFGRATAARRSLACFPNRTGACLPRTRKRLAQLPDRVHSGATRDRRAHPVSSTETSGILAKIDKVPCSLFVRKRAETGRPRSYPSGKFGCRRQPD